MIRQLRQVTSVRDNAVFRLFNNGDNIKKKNENIKQMPTYWTFYCVLQMLLSGDMYN